ncbi:TIGR01458 family HAD-type hydrolase [Marinobacterium sediminicola]|uniref:Haloacid dehalogenase-like hydrolase domain-containing protein 2 n=1 Tax=Marinobacterium sediminicola TaxID=518898 RepID=A0ABY1RYT1_9GAMM|nr:TIGR01458 family HAD-type hydrolase [Marinobacterium sediminicola]ULG68059.1 TIGR01458 family HAD-type hydrolase [Marinobacterium sediminicola]SMR73431.1 HAD-superfamily subfamily IIA hydrolase, TIGR01458 [Marinobacterium sediminicola]
MKVLDNAQGMLIDLDGVLYVGNQAIDGAQEALAHIRKLALPVRFLTNTTTQSRGSLSRKLKALGFSIEPEEILSTPSVAANYLHQAGVRSCFLAISDAIKSEFEAFEPVENAPDAVLIGDIGRAWNYDLINRLAQMVMSGARLVALHKNRYWQTEEGFRVDIGAFVAAIEYASGVEATIIGKPSAAFFQAGAQALKCQPEYLAMIGDDIESDVGGAQHCGMKGVLVRTGKFRPEQMVSSSIVPDVVLDSIAQLPEHL